MKKDYSILKGIGKAVASVIVFGIPFLTTSYPEIANLTIGGLGVIFVNFVKYNYFTE